MRLFVGLGNPGPKYAQNRHNIGFMILDRIADDHGFAPWRSKFQGAITEGTIGGEKVLLLKPMTFMNKSGQSVGDAARFYKIAPGDMTVFHDELDLAPGKARVKQGGGHAGHNGLRSIHAHMGADYGRVRLGIGHPGHKDRVAGYVLSDFAKADADWLDDLIRGASDGAPALAQGDGGRFMNAVALRVAPPRSSTGKQAPGKKASGKQPSGKSGSGKPETGDPAATKATGDSKAAPKATPTETPAPEPQDTRTAMQKLADRFR